MENMYNTYYDKPICYGHKGECECTNMQEQTRPTYVLDYEDTALIPFSIDQEFEGQLIIITLYDFRHEPIFESQQFIDEEGYVYLKIDKETSFDLLKRGVYYCGIQAREVFLDVNEEYQYGDNVTTIMNQNECMINVR